jgi:acetamidase/formamidase
MPSTVPTTALSAAAHAALAEPVAHVALPAEPATCQWGAIDPDTAPVLTVASGTEIAVEAVTHHAGDAPDLLFDDGIAAIWDGIAPTDRGPGVHLLTGPIAVEGATVGQTLAVEIVGMRPRLPYGSNVAAHWGLLHDETGKERVTIYGLDDAPEGAFGATASPLFAYDFKGRPLYDAPGFVTEPEDRVEEAFTRPVAVPVRPHLGVLGVAPGEAGRRSSIPPGVFGGNVDDWRFGPGATIYLPVLQDGALLYVGDPHFAQGDGEVCGTAIEASADVVIRVAVVDDVVVRSPTLQWEGLWATHGFGATLDEAMRMATTLMIELLGRRAGLSYDDAYSLCSVAVDLGVTQVVDGTVGCHAALRTDILL